MGDPIEASVSDSWAPEYRGALAAQRVTELAERRRRLATGEPVDQADVDRARAAAVDSARLAIKAADSAATAEEQSAAVHRQAAATGAGDPAAHLRHAQEDEDAAALDRRRAAEDREVLRHRQGQLDEG